MQNSLILNNINLSEARIRDYFSLLKPRVMSLVVFTGLAGLLLAPGSIHPLIATVAIFCIALGSGAAGAFNMWYEREIDAVMKRTSNRPLPKKIISPENAFDFACVCSFAAVFLMATAVNLLSAALLLTAIIYYVFIYTIWLKPRTPQNIVIGGGAGAFPPLIGWASVTNNLSIEPLILFAIIFMWTPPHFWALALYRNEDYRKAGIPMLPVIAGVEKTKRDMLIYTILLFALTLSPYFINMSGIIYLTGATALGLNFLYHAIKVYRSPVESNCRAMFKFSIVYLFLIFTILILDKL